MEEALLALSTYGYIGLFIASFLAATVLPFSSEIVFTTLIYSTDANAWICIAVGTAGNTLGALTCYALGRMGKLEWIERYLRIPASDIEKWNNRLKKGATWASFFTFLPGIGDVIAVCAGYLRSPLWLTAICITAGKFLRYLVWVYLTYWVFL